MATPLVGIFSDRSKGFPSWGLGRRKLWYLMGTFLVLLCFTMVWAIDAPKDIFGNHNETVEVVYYALAASFFNVGWAAVQVSHMAFVPELTPVPCERVQLNSYRYGFTVLSNVMVYILFLIFVSLIAPTGDDTAGKYRGVGLCVIGLGCITSFIFITGVRERVNSVAGGGPTLFEAGSTLEAGPREDSPTRPSVDGSSSEEHVDDPRSPLLRGSVSSVDDMNEMEGGEKRVNFPTTLSDPNIGTMTWRDWLHNRVFYAVAAVYMLTRMVVNLSQVYVPIFLLHTVSMPSFSLALVPMLMYIFSFLMTMKQSDVDRKLGRRKSFALGACLCWVACIGFYVAPSNDDNAVLCNLTVYGSAALLGVGGTGMMVGAVSLQSDLVGNNINSGAFVFGAHSFADKMANGVAILGVQLLQNSLQDEERSANDDDTCYSHECRSFIRIVLSAVTGAAALAGMLLIFSFDMAPPPPLSSPPPRNLHGSKDRNSEERQPLLDHDFHAHQEQRRSERQAALRAGSEPGPRLSRVRGSPYKQVGGESTKVEEHANEGAPNPQQSSLGRDETDVLLSLARRLSPVSQDPSVGGGVGGDVSPSVVDQQRL